MILPSRLYVYNGCNDSSNINHLNINKERNKKGFEFYG